MEHNKTFNSKIFIAMRIGVRVGAFLFLTACGQTSFETLQNSSTIASDSNKQTQLITSDQSSLSPISISQNPTAIIRPTPNPYPVQNQPVATSPTPNPYPTQNPPVATSPTPNPYPTQNPPVATPPTPSPYPTQNPPSPIVGIEPTPIHGICNNSEKLSCYQGAVGPGNGQNACGTNLTWTCIGERGGITASCSRPNDFCPTSCNSFNQGYALCPVRAAILPNGRPSESTLVAACIGGMGKIVASSGNFSIIQTLQSDGGIPGSNLYLKTVDKSGVVVGNGAYLMSPGDVASALVLSGLYQGEEWRNNFKELARQLDEKGIAVRPDRALRRGSDMGIDLVELANNRLGGAYDWTSDTNVTCKGPSALNKLKNNQIVANLLRISDANSGLLGKRVPTFVSQALGDGPGGVVCYSITSIPGLTSAMLTRTGNVIGSLSETELSEFLKSITFDLFRNEFFRF